MPAESWLSVAAPHLLCLDCVALGVWSMLWTRIYDGDRGPTPGLRVLEYFEADAALSSFFCWPLCGV